MLNSKNSPLAFSALRVNGSLQSLQVGYALRATGLTSYQAKAPEPLENLRAELLQHEHEVVWRVPRIQSVLSSNTEWHFLSTLLETGNFADGEVLVSPRELIPKEVSASFHAFDLGRLFDFKSSVEVLWIKHQPYGIWWPYGLTQEQKQLLKMPHLKKSRNEADLHHFNLSAREEIYKKGYGCLVDVLNQLQLQSIAQYFSNLIQDGLLVKGDPHTPYRYWAHNEALSRFLQIQLLPFVRAMTEKEWEPTFTTFLGYQHPADLRRHLDREQASLTISLLVDYLTAGVQSKDNWHFYIEADPSAGSVAEILVGVGNAVAFQGEKHVHFRRQLPPDEESRSICFHYAEPGFRGKRL